MALTRFGVLIDCREIASGATFEHPQRPFLAGLVRHPANMAQFRAKRLDLGCYVTPRIIRDHTKRKVFNEFEPER
jgi:hypothetical protein